MGVFSNPTFWAVQLWFSARFFRFAGLGLGLDSDRLACMDWVEMDRFRFLGGTVLLLREREGELLARDGDRRLLRLR